MRKGVNKVVSIHKLRIVRVAMIELNLQGVMGKNETWLVFGFHGWMGASQKNPDALKVRNLKNGTLPGKVLSFHSERNDRNFLTISFHFQFVASHQGKNQGLLGTKRNRIFLWTGSGGGGTQKSLIRWGSAPRSNPLPFYVPFFQKRHPFRIPFIGKRHPFHIPS